MRKSKSQPIGQWYWPRFLYILMAAFIAAWGWNIGQLMWSKVF